jgi:hypothetical protein
VGLARPKANRVTPRKAFVLALISISQPKSPGAVSDDDFTEDCSRNRILKLELSGLSNDWRKKLRHRNAHKHAQYKHSAQALALAFFTGLARASLF